jgi:hypothetical protein
VLEVISSPSLEYSKVIELDKTIRDFYIPVVFRKAGVALSRPSIMQKASLSTALEAGSRDDLSCINYLVAYIF